VPTFIPRPCFVTESGGKSLRNPYAHRPSIGIRCA
jgi:hypothetical protein